MKKLLMLLSLAVVAVPSFAQDSILERVAGELLSDRFGIDVADVLGIRRDRNQDVFDLGPTLSMSRYGGSSASEVQRLRASGLGWGEIAHRIGMHPGTFNKLRKQGYFDRDSFWDDVYRRRYGISQNEIDLIRKRGGREDDLLAAAIIGRSSGRKPVEVFDRYRQDKNWSTTSGRYKVDLKNWKAVGKKVGWEGASTPPKKPIIATRVKGKSGSTVKGNSGSKGNSGNSGSTKSKGSDKGKGSTKTAGPGKGKGKGKGGGDL